MLERMRREAEPLSHELAFRCRQLARHVGLARGVQFAQSALLAVPVVVGWLRPIVLIPISTLTGLSPQQIDSVILHELAHIRRLDAFANLFQILVETLLFYHPAVWWVSHRIRIEREHCCDDIAVAIGGDSFGYAMALTLLESERAFPSMALAATGGALKTRVKRLLGQDTAPSRPYHLAPLAVALIALVLGACTLDAMATAPTDATPAQMSVAVAEPTPAPVIAAAPVSAPAPAAATTITPAVHSAPLPTTEPASYIGALAAAGFKDLSASQLIALKSVGVTPDEAAAWRSAGFTMSAAQLVNMHAVGVRPSDAAGFRDAGLGMLSANELSSLRSVGATPDYVRQMREAGFDSKEARDFLTARSVGVTPEFVARLRRAGVADLSPRRIVTLKSSGLD
jgi:hypothetical protein